MEPSEEIDLLIQAVQNGDQAAVSRLFAQYFDRLVTLARKRLPARFAKMRDGEDVAQSVFKSFVRRAQAGDFPALRGEGELSALLVTMVKRRILKYIEYETRERRDQQKTISYSAECASAFPAAGSPTGDFSAEAMRNLDRSADVVIGEVESALQVLETERQRQVARLILEGISFSDIASSLDLHPSTVYRTYDRILDIWKQRGAE